ncbi:MAG: M56 family metallopeptidase [Planctomycetota bacterium]
MSAWLQSIADHSGLLAGVTTAILGSGVVAVRLARSPIHRQRLGEAAVLVALVWLALALVPLPRLALATSHAAAGPPGVEAPTPLIAGSTSTDDALATPFPLPGNDVESAPDPEPLPPVEALDQSERRAGTGTPASTLPPWWTPWIMVVAVGCAYLGLGLLHLVWVLCRATAAPPWLVQLMTTITAAHLKAPPRLCISTRASRPFCVALPRGMIVIPASLCHVDETASLRHVLCHEIAHLRQHDGFGQALFALALPCLAVHPLFWWLRQHTRFAAELLADDWAAAQGERGDYARHLVRLATRTPARVVPLLGAVPILSSPSAFYRRMTMLLERKTRLDTRCSTVWRVAQATAVTILTVALAVAFGVNDSHAQEAKPDQRDQLTPQLLKQRDDLQAEVNRLQELLAQRDQDPAESAATLEQRLRRIIADRNAKQQAKQNDDVQRLFERLDSNDSGQRWDALDRLAKRDDARSYLPLYRSLLKDADAFVQFRAISTLSELNDQGAVPDLIELLHDDDRIVRDEACNALNRLTGRNDWKDYLARGKPSKTGAEHQALDRQVDSASAPVNAREAPSTASITAANTYILDLVTRTIDLRSEVEKGRFKFARAERLVKSGAQTEDELAIEKIELDKSVKQLEAVSRMMEIEREAAKHEEALLSKQIAAGRARGADTVELELRMALVRGRVASLDLSR